MNIDFTQIAVIDLQHYLILAAILFCLGLYCVMTRRNAIGILMGVELILNAANINLVAFSHYVAGSISGQVFAIFVITLAAAEATVALAIVLGVFRKFRTINADEVTALRE